MRIEYRLIKGLISLPIIIPEKYKEDFKEIVGWDDEKFKENTCRRFIGVK